jgi:4-amino-4-deoxy-L-arabinose transferase-like glycosyltransferase
MARTPAAEADAAPSPDGGHRALLLRLACAAIALGVLARLAMPFVSDLYQDGATFAAMGDSWSRTHELLMPHGDVGSSNTTPTYSQHHPPGYPTYLGLFFSVAGYGLAQAKLAAVLVSLAAVAVVWLATRDLHGPLAGAMAAGLVALEPHLVWATGTGFSESLTLLLFTGMAWAAVRSLRDDRFVLLAALFAGLLYLTRISRAGLAWFLLVAGAAALGWGVYHKRRAFFRSPWYLGALGVFLLVLLLWAWRNVEVLAGGDWSTASPLRALLLPDPLGAYRAILGKLVLFALFLAFYAAFFAPDLRRSLQRPRDKEATLLWLLFGAVFTLGALISGLYWLTDGGAFWWLDNHRYLIVGLVPLSWLFLRDLRPDRAAVVKYGAMAAAFLLVSTVVVLNPTRNPEARAGEWMSPYLEPGDNVYLGNVAKYSLYPYVDAPRDVNFTLFRLAGPRITIGGPPPTWFVTDQADLKLGGYTKVAEFRQQYLRDAVLWGDEATTEVVSRVYLRTDLVAGRGVPTGVNETRGWGLG